jgi:hypothetical protein
MESLCGKKHLEARQLTKSIHSELTKHLLTQKVACVSKPFFARVALDEQLVNNTRINPKLVKKCNNS